MRVPRECNDGVREGEKSQMLEECRTHRLCLHSLSHDLFIAGPVRLSRTTKDGKLLSISGRNEWFLGPQVEHFTDGQADVASSNTPCGLSGSMIYTVAVGNVFETNADKEQATAENGDASVD